MKSLKLKKNILQPRKNYFDFSSLYVLNTVFVDEGILLPYFVKNPISFGVALFDKKEPGKLLWRSANPVWETEKKLHLESLEEPKLLLTQHRYQ